MRFLVITVLIAWAACGAKADVPGELVGSWQAASEDPGSTGRGWTKEYTLRDDGTFVMTGYPPIRVTGRWRVAEREGNRFRVVLTEQKMRMSERDEASDWADEDGWAVLDGATLRWQDATFRRTSQP